MSVIITLWKWIVTSTCRNICLLYTYLLIFFHTAVILRHVEKLSQYFTSASPLFIMPAVYNHQLPLVLSISIQKMLTVLHSGINCNIRKLLWNYQHIFTCECLLLHMMQLLLKYIWCALKYITIIYIIDCMSSYYVAPAIAWSSP